MPSTSCVASMRPSSTANSARSISLLGGELAGDEVEVGSDARKPLARDLVEAPEDLDRADLLRRHHRTTLIGCAVRPEVSAGSQR